MAQTYRTVRGTGSDRGVGEQYDAEAENREKQESTAKDKGSLGVDACSREVIFCSVVSFQKGLAGQSYRMTD